MKLKAALAEEIKNHETTISYFLFFLFEILLFKIKLLFYDLIFKYNFRTIKNI